MFGARWGLPRWTFAMNFEVHGLSFGVVCIILRLAVLVQYRV